jgi:hypothetical protein
MTSTPQPTSDILDLGCGPNKVAGSYGVDHFSYPGVDAVVNLDAEHWDLPTDAFREIHARHVIEHVRDPVRFMSEVHRIARDGALVRIVTPHFSSIDSWRDPTHLRHLARDWHRSFTSSYLAAQVPAFEHVETTVSFGSSLISLAPKLISRLFGIDRWEKHFAFSMPARNISSVLRVVKRIPAEAR